VNGASVLDDHRRLGAATLAVLLGLTLTVSVALVAAGRAQAVMGVAVGALIAGADVVLLTRGVTRFGRLLHRTATPRGLTGGLLSRFLAVAALLGLAMATPSLNPIAVVGGFLLMPFALATVGCTAICRLTDDGGAGRRQIAR
jgi:hypothetical protein